jgi:hypothetical protein
MIAGHLEEMPSHGVEPMVAGDPSVAVQRREEM